MTEPSSILEEEEEKKEDDTMNHEDIHENIHENVHENVHEDHSSTERMTSMDNPFQMWVNMFLEELQEVQQSSVERHLLRQAYQESMNTYHEELFPRDVQCHLDFQTDHRQGPFYSFTTCLEKCFICFELFQPQDQVIELRECRHLFHTSCIQEAIQFQKNCPLCRQVIKTKTKTSLDDQSVSDTSEAVHNTSESV